MNQSHCVQVKGGKEIIMGEEELEHLQRSAGRSQKQREGDYENLSRGM